MILDRPLPSGRYHAKASRGSAPPIFAATVADRWRLDGDAGYPSPSGGEIKRAQPASVCGLDKGAAQPPAPAQ